MTKTQAVILVVDDEAADIAVMRASLARAGFQVLTAASHNEASAQFDEHPEIIMLVTDISLPGKTGLRLADEFRRKRPGLKILLVSGWVGAEFLEYCRIPIAAPYFLPKPFRSSEFVTRVRQVLASDEEAPWFQAGDAAAGSGES